MLGKLLFSFILVTVTSGAHDTTCDEDQKHFADVCFTPKPYEKFDLMWYISAQPADGWYMELGNDITRLHVAEILHGKLLTLQDDYNNTCYRAKSVLIETGLDANVTGFSNLHGTWKCGFSKDTKGVFLCDGDSDGPSKYHENFSIYPIFSDNTNFVLDIVCFANGQAGWVVMAKTPKLSDDSKKIIAEEVKKIGFVYDDRVVMYNESC